MKADKRFQELDKEIIELTNSKIEAENTLAIQKKRFLAEQITDDEMRIEALRNVLELEKEIELERLENKRDSYNEGTQAYVDAQNELNAKKQEFFEADVSLDNELNTVRKTNADADLAQDEARRQSKIDTLDTISDIAGRETKLGKALLIAKALLQAKEMIMEAKGTLFTAKQSLTKATVKGAEANGSNCTFIRKGVLSELVIFGDKLYANVAGPSEDSDTLYSVIAVPGEVLSNTGGWRDTGY